MRLLLGILLTFSTARSVFSQTDLGGGVITKTNVKYWADLTLDVRDIEQGVGSGDGGKDLAFDIYMNGRNSAQTTGLNFKLTQLSSDLAGLGTAKATPQFLFQLYGLADRSNDLNKLSNNLSYADSFIRSAIEGGKVSAADAIRAHSMWMYATHLLYDGLRTCQLLVEADNPAQFTLGTAGFDEFIALWIGTGQTPGSPEGYGLYALAEKGCSRFDVLDEDFIKQQNINDLDECLVNRKIKDLYHQASAQLSISNTCGKNYPETPRILWSIVNQIVSQMHVPLLRQLIISVLEKDVEATQVYAIAVVPQAAQCRPSTFKRLKTLLLDNTPDFTKSQMILQEIQNLYSCFGLSCEEIGEIRGGLYDNIPKCYVAGDRAPIAQYYPSTSVGPIARIDYDILQIRILTSLGAFPHAKMWYLYGRNSPVQRDSDLDPFSYYSIADLAVASNRKNADYYSDFLAYFDDPNYADTMIRDTLDARGKWGPKSIAQRSAVITETSAFLVLYLHLIAQINSAVKQCTGEATDEQGMYDLTHPWDEVVALLVGSLEGAEEGGSSDVQDGQLIWSLGTRRGFQFQTLNKKGYAKINSEFEDLLYAGKGEIDAQECEAFKMTADEVKRMTLVPLMQSVMKYAIQNEQRDANSESEDLALGEVFALAILPILNALDPGLATIIEENMVFYEGTALVRDGAQTVAGAIGAAAEKAGLKCRMLGSAEQAKPCKNGGVSSAFGLRPIVIALVATGASLFSIL